MKLPRRRFLHLAAGAAALPAVSRIARAQAYPSRPVRIIAGFPAGSASRHHRAPRGSTAVGATRPTIRHRKPAGCRQQYRHRTGRESAAGRLYAASDHVAANAINASLYENLNFNFIRDIAPVASIGRNPFVMVVNPSVPAKTVPEFIAYAKANPGKINMASSGIGSAPHVFGELFKMMTGVDLVHVPYRGNFMPDLLGGQVQVAFTTNTSGRSSISERQIARPCGDHCDAPGGAAGHPRHGRICAGLRGERLVWRRCAQEHTCRNYRKAQQGDQCRRGRSRYEGAPCRLGRCADVDDTRRIRRNSSPTKPRNGPR